MASSILLFVCLIITFNQVRSQECKVPDRRDEEVFPDLAKIAPRSYKFLLEANDENLKTTSYETEYFDREGNRKKMVTLTQNSEVTYVAFGNSLEQFTIKDGQCDTTKLSTTDINSYFNLPYGPGMLAAAFKEWTTHGSIGLESRSETVRGMTCNVWTWCAKNGTTLKIYFTDPATERPYGLSGIPVPVRVIATNSMGQIYYVEYYRMEIDLSEEELNTAFQIPDTIGCRRLVDSSNKAPEFGNKNMNFEAEIVYTPFINNSNSFTYITNVKYAIHRKLHLFSVQWTPWQTSKDNKMAAPGDSMLQVHDSMNGVTYTMNLSKQTCDITKSRLLMFPLPDGFDLGKIDEDILFFNNTGYQYLGKRTERGIPVLVYEKTVQDEFEIDRRIVTRYHMDTNTVAEGEFNVKNAPVKLIMWDTNTDTQKFVGRLVINFYSFQTSFSNPAENFDISSCFKDEDQLKWFQILFPMGEIPASEVIPQMPMAKTSLQELLSSLVPHASPMRIPRLQVDVDSSNIYVTGLILDRPPAILDFSETKNKRLKETGKENQLVTLATLYKCAKTCLENPTCQYFSYCGAACTIALNEVNQASDTEDKQACSLFKNDAYGKNIPTADQLSQALEDQVETRSLTMDLVNKNGDILSFVADKYKDGIAFGIDGLERKNQDLPENTFTVFKPETKFKPSASIPGTTIIGRSFDACQSSCRSGFCESLSYCLATQECIRSAKHVEDILPTDLEENTQCITLTRSYVSRFEKNPGLVVVTTAQKEGSATTEEGCAKECYKESGFQCLSFDFCTYESKETCLLHAKRYSDPAEMKLSSELTTECTHFVAKPSYVVNS